jgi:hypothetical protein
VSKQASIYQEEFQHKYASINHIPRNPGSLLQKSILNASTWRITMTLLWLAPDLPAASQLSTSLKAKKDGKNARVALIEVGKKGE